MRIGPTFREGRIRWIRAKFEGNPYREMMVLKTKFDTRFSICCFLLFLNTSKHHWNHVLCKEIFENSRQFCIAFEVGPIRIYATLTVVMEQEEKEKDTEYVDAIFGLLDIFGRSKKK